MSYKKVLLGLSLAVVITAAAVTTSVGFAQAEDPPTYPANQPFMSQRSMRWMSEGEDGRMADELGEVMHDAMIAAFADALGLDPVDLEAMLESGENMMDIALAQGFSSEDVWEIMQTVREDARAAVLESGIEIPSFRENMPDNVPFDCDEEGKDGRRYRSQGRSGPQLNRRSLLPIDRSFCTREASRIQIGRLLAFSLQPLVGGSTCCGRHYNPGMSQKILIVEDEIELVKVIRDYLEKAGFRVDSVDNGSAAVSAFKHNPPDLVLLDLNLPGMDGLDVAREIRRINDVPIIMVTARVEETDKLIGLELGADDYITKPFSPREVVARVRAVLRRTQKPVTTPEIIESGDIMIDLHRHRVNVASQPVELTPTEFDLLVVMA